MLEKIELENYRCFEKSKLIFRDTTIIVGKNNSGKSTLIEAIRLVSMAARKCDKTVYKDSPDSLELPKRIKGFKLSVEKLKIDLTAIVNFYQNTNAIIKATFKDKTKIVIYLNDDVAFATIYDNKGSLIASKQKAATLNLGIISILPQIGLIRENEKILASDTVTADMDTYLSSLHFRNEIYLYKDQYYKSFKKLAESTWTSLKIINISADDNINLLIEDSRFPSEIGYMGSGLKMWLQIMWFIARSQNCDTVILDEPDVYMHPDLQIKLLKIVKNMFKQVIIATHSVEIISNVEPRNIVTINDKDRTMVYAGDIKAVQGIVDDIGSVHNISLAKLGSARKCLFVEGDDMKILQQFENILYPEDVSSIGSIPSISLGGWTRINEAFGASKLFNESAGSCFKCIAILDKDYYTDEHINQIKNKAGDNNLILHIWGKKEIENYILIPRVIFRITKLSDAVYDEFLQKYEKLVDAMKEDIIDSCTTKIYEANNHLVAAGTCGKRAREYINAKWTDLHSKLDVVGGKALLRKTNEWIRSEYGKSCSMKRILDAFTKEDVPDEMLRVIDMLRDS